MSIARNLFPELALGICDVSKTNEVYSFTAKTAVVYVKLTMSNVGGQAGVFFLTKADLREESTVQNIKPEQIYSWTVANKHFMKITAGEYSLFVTKAIRESVHLYEIKDASTLELVNEIVTIKRILPRGNHIKRCRSAVSKV